MNYKVAMYYTNPFEMGGTEKTMYERGKMLKKLGYNITYIFNSKTCPLDTLEKWSEVGKVIRQDYCTEHFDFCIYDAIYNLPNINADKKIQVFNGNLIDGGEKYFCDLPIDEYISVSEDCRQQVLKQCGIDSKIIPNIINQEEIRKLMLEKYDLKKAKYNFVVVARFDTNKGYHKLEKLIKEVHEKLKDYQFVFVGSNNQYPQYMNEMKKLYKDYNVVFVGKQDNPYKYMYNSDYVLIPSSYESQCMVLDEALTCGTPVISTDFEVAKQKINGKNGLLVSKDFQDYDLEAILKLKKGFEYNYPSIEKLWLEVLKPFEKKDIKFSIIIPNYNNEAWLKKCLNSVLNQTYKNYELIFVDDMSTDNSLEIVSKYHLDFVDTCKNIEVISLKQKRLNGGARNVGILEATGDYIVCLDSDDWFKDNNVLEMLNKEITNEDVIFTGFDLFDGKKEGLFPYIPKSKNLYEAFTENVCAIWTKVVKTSILKTVLFPEGTLAEDRVHHYRLIEKCTKFKNIQQSTHVWNRANTTSTTTKRTDLWESSCIKHLAEMYLFIKMTNNEEYKKYVQDKYNRQLKDIMSGKYNQL